MMLVLKIARHAQLIYIHVHIHASETSPREVSKTSGSPAKHAAPIDDKIIFQPATTTNQCSQFQEDRRVHE